MKTKRLLAAAILGAAAFAAAQTGGGFRFDGPLSRVISPNGDAINDVAVFCFDNPSDSGVSAVVYTLLGTRVADLGPRQASGGNSCPASTSLVPKRQHVDWDPRAAGQVSSGVFVYRIQAEGQTYTGTLLVVR